jgi:2-polyprenyl-3-methyl-5-hydroxy-6-metoxy-1,4-benzoquinol methylase
MTKMHSIEDLVEEIFCLNFEMKLFSQYINYGILERWVPGYTDKITEECHVTRYDFVKNYVKGKSVLDIACGTGKGSLILTEAGAANVLGADIDNEAVRYATHRHKHSNLNYCVADATNYLSRELYDVIVSFETIEHLEDVDGFLRNINLNLNQGGLFFVSTPISSKNYRYRSYNIYHKQEWGVYKFQEIVSEFLTVEKSYLQLFPEQSVSKLSYYWNKIYNRKNQPAITSSIYELHEIVQKGKIAKLGKSIKGYQLLQCRKK